MATPIYDAWSAPLTLLNPKPQHRLDRSSLWATASAALHLLVLAVLLFHRHLNVAPRKLPGDEHGHRLTLTFTPGRAMPQASVAAPAPPRPAPPVALLHPPVRTAPQSSPSAAPAKSPSTAAPGNDAFGSGNVTLALATFFPRPVPDIPAHTHGDVIVDVIIDETGRITTSKVTQGLAPSVDQIVLATIQTWTFKPATKDGVPVPSEQELLFHYDRS